jgi:primary-amine oxidase
MVLKNMPPTATPPSAAARRANAESQRYWKVINPNKTNAVGSPVGYKLDATNCITPFVWPDSPSGKPAGFVRNHVWVTAFDAEERYPAGEHINHSDGAGGIADFIAKDRPIENADIVLWHVFGLHHPFASRISQCSPRSRRASSSCPPGSSTATPASTCRLRSTRRVAAPTHEGRRNRARRPIARPRATPERRNRIA